MILKNTPKPFCKLEKYNWIRADHLLGKTMPPEVKSIHIIVDLQQFGPAVVEFKNGKVLCGLSLHNKKLVKRCSSTEIGKFFIEGILSSLPQEN